SLHRYSSRRLEGLKPLRKEFRIWPKFALAWKQQANARCLLQSITQHRAVGFLQDIRANVDASERINAYDVRIERGMMDRAKSKAVWNNRFTLGMPVRQNVRSVEKF